MTIESTPPVSQYDLTKAVDGEITLPYGKNFMQVNMIDFIVLGAKRAISAVKVSFTQANSPFVKIK